MPALSCHMIHITNFISTPFEKKIDSPDCPEYETEPFHSQYLKCRKNKNYFELYSAHNLPKFNQG